MDLIPRVTQAYTEEKYFIPLEQTPLLTVSFVSVYLCAGSFEESMQSANCISLGIF